jgi:hypothetical protein
VQYKIKTNNLKKSVIRSLFKLGQLGGEPDSIEKNETSWGGGGGKKIAKPFFPPPS